MSFEKPTWLEGQLLTIGVLYEGPWERLSTWLLAIDWRTNEIKHEIKTHGLRDRLAAWCELRDHAWRRRYIARNARPSKRWERRSGDTTGEQQQ
jgi:hypothetical protein